GTQAQNDLAASVERNAMYRNTYRNVIGGSQTAQRQAAAEADKISNIPRPSPTLYGRGEQLVLGALDTLRNASVARNREEIARWMATRNPAAVERLREQLIEHARRVQPRSEEYERTVRGGITGLSRR